MEFDVFVKQGKFTGDIESLVRNVGQVEKPFDLSTASPSAKIVGGWVKDLIKVTKERLQRSGINASNGLSQSINIVPIDLTESKLTIGIEMDGYWKFVDLGVKGAKSSVKAPNSPFQYREKGPPPNKLAKYIAFKSIPVVPRKIRGTQQMRTRQEQALVDARGMSRVIRDKGTKATRFFSDSLTDDKINVLVESIATALGKEISLSMNL